MNKNLKKITASILSVAVLASASLSAMAKPNYTFDTSEADGLMPVKEIIFFEDFALPQTGDLADPGSVWGEGKGTETISVVKKTSNASATKGFLFINNVGAEQFYKTQIANPLTGEYTIEFKFNKNVNHSKDATADNMFFGAGYTDGTNDNLAINLGIGADDRPYYVNADGDKVPFITDTKTWNTGFEIYKNWDWNEGDWLNKNWASVSEELAENTASWYTVKVDVNTEAGTYDVYLNGALCVEDAAFIPADGIDWQTAGINVPFMMEADYVIGARYFYDDIAIYRDYKGVTNIYADDFNGYAAEKAWGSGSLNSTGIAGLGVSNIVGKSGTITAKDNQLVAVYNGSESGAIANGLVADDDITVDFDFTVSDFAEGVTDNWVPIAGITGAPNGGGIIFKVNENGTLNFHWYNYVGAAVKSIGTISVGEPHHFTFHVDFKEMRYDLYVDGKTILYNEGMSANASQAASIVNGEGIALAFGHKDKAMAKIAYDNIRVYRDERENVIAELPAMLATIFPGTDHLKNTFELPTVVAGYEDYKITWSAEEGTNITVAEDGKTAIVKLTALTQNLNLIATVSDADGEYSVSRKMTVKVLDGPNAGINVDSENKIVTATARNIPDGKVLILALYQEGKLLDADMTVLSENEKTAQIDYSSYDAGEYSVAAYMFDGVILKPFCGKAGRVAITIE